MSTQTLNPIAYGKLLANVQPHPIKSGREYDRLVAEVGRLMERGEKNLSAEESSLLEMMSILIEEYDRKHYSLSPSEKEELRHKSKLTSLPSRRGAKPRNLLVGQSRLLPHRDFCARQ